MLSTSPGCLAGATSPRPSRAPPARWSTMPVSSARCIFHAWSCRCRRSISNLLAFALQLGTFLCFWATSNFSPPLAPPSASAAPSSAFRWWCCRSRRSASVLALALGAHGEISRLHPFERLHHPDLDVCHAGDLSAVADPRGLALACVPQSHGHAGRDDQIHVALGQGVVDPVYLALSVAMTVLALVSGVHRVQQGRKDLRRHRLSERRFRSPMIAPIIEVEHSPSVTGSGSSMPVRCARRLSDCSAAAASPKLTGF